MPPAITPMKFITPDQTTAAIGRNECMRTFRHFRHKLSKNGVTLPGDLQRSVVLGDSNSTS
jgi:hypothetical protein